MDVVKSRQKVESIIQQSIELVEMRDYRDFMDYKHMRLQDFILEMRTIELVLPRQIGKSYSVKSLSTGSDLIFYKQPIEYRKSMGQTLHPMIYGLYSDLEKYDTFKLGKRKVVWFDTFFWKSEDGIKPYVEKMIEKQIIDENSIIICIK